MCDVKPRRVYYTRKLLLADVIITRPIIIITNFFLPTKKCNEVCIVIIIIFVGNVFILYCAPECQGSEINRKKKKFFFPKTVHHA